MNSRAMSPGCDSSSLETRKLSPGETESLRAVPGRTLMHPLDSILDPLDPAVLFPRTQPLEVELGSGDGSFAVEYARRHPERNLLAVERLLGRLRKVDRKGLRAGLENLRLVRIEASYLVAHLLRCESVRALHVYFPDPWPKRKHRKHRLVNAAFTELAERVLVPGGAVYLRTDDADYFSQMTAVFAANTSFFLGETPADLAGLVTDFERDFLARGVPTLRAAYERR